MKFRDIPQFPQAHYKVNVSWMYLEDWLLAEKDVVDMDPDFQRGHVWTQEQQSAYVEYTLKGGEGGRNVYWNCPGWPNVVPNAKLVLVDGKQRIEAVRAFMHDKITAFGRLHSEFEDNLPYLCGPDFIFQIARLERRSDILQWYLDFNSGGTPHSREELNRVKGLLEEEEKTTPRV